MQLLELYKRSPYEPLVPERADENQRIFKFNSPQHYISWVGGLHEKFQRGNMGNDSSETSDQNFTLSRDLPHAYEVIRETKFTPEDNSVLESKISEIKKGTRYSDEGYELEIPEYLAGSDRIWLQPKHRKTPTRIVDDVLIIDAAYSCGQDAERSRRIGMGILEAIYRRKVIPRKMVVAFAATHLKSSDNSDKNTEFLTAIDVSFQDLNGIAKMLHPSAFRRLWFRVVEIYPDLTMGYGHCRQGSEARTQKGYISIDQLHRLWMDNTPTSKQPQFEKEIDTFLGITNR